MIRSAAERLRSAAAWLRDLGFVLIALVLGFVGTLVVIAGVNPLDSPSLMVLFGAAVAVLATHHFWYARHRYEVDHDRSRLRARERRGF